ncbi:ADP-ribosylglycohydrolase family protein [Oscillatoria sp. FACHB-1406]|uniref:ADP-ribosylglycohydrolase family protein n=1 Tax=Oscillatoria sp. FACHB-1406 TaxID=2692846 RepID=UPI001687CF62|nr:ADP-ribosylglycohydrolase family protein [Oscillatoria sp. FACHB-1406]
MLLEVAIGDAYGAGFEFAEPDFVSVENDLQRYRQHPCHKLKPGSYTDDTQMSLAIAELLISHQLWTRENLADKFVEVFRRDPREGYAGKFYQFLLEVRDGTEFLANIQGNSDRSGAAMRATPIGILPSIEKVIEAATIQAAITHNSNDGINAAVAAALMVHYFIYRLGAKAQLGDFIEQWVPGYNWGEKWEGKVTTLGWHCVKAAITAVMQNDSLSKVLRDSIAFTGDVDTVAAIALGTAACSEEITTDLPSTLIDTLENGHHGKDYILNLDWQLMSLI